MRIIQIVPRFELGGAEIMCENLTYALQRAGHCVTVVSLYDYRSAITGRLEAAGVDIRYLGKRRGPDIALLIRLCKLLRALRPDAVHSHLYASEYAVPAAMMAGISCRVHTLHNVAEKENTRAGRLLNRLFFRRFHTVPVALSRLVRETVEAEYDLPAARIPVITNGIDLTKCLPKQDYATNIPFTVLHIGRFVPEKNHMLLLRAFGRFHARYAQSELHLVGDGETRTKVEAYVRENGLSSCVRFFGLQENVYPFLQKADVFVLPSLYEGIPITLIEAMGSGLPIVASAVGGVPDMLDEGCAQLIPPEEEALFTALCRYYEDEGLRRTNGISAKARAACFSAEAMAVGYLEVYRA